MDYSQHCGLEWHLKLYAVCLFKEFLLVFHAVKLIVYTMHSQDKYV